MRSKIFTTVLFVVIGIFALNGIHQELSSFLYGLTVEQTATIYMVSVFLTIVATIGVMSIYLHFRRPKEVIDVEAHEIIQEQEDEPPITALVPIKKGGIPYMPPTKISVQNPKTKENVSVEALFKFAALGTNRNKTEISSHVQWERARDFFSVYGIVKAGEKAGQESIFTNGRNNSDVVAWLSQQFINMNLTPAQQREVSQWQTWTQKVLT